MRKSRLSLKERRHLEKQLRTSHDARLYRRTLAVLEYDRGKSITEIARTLHISRPSVYRWIEKYRASLDPACLRDEDRSGRPCIWTEECTEWLQAFVRRSPAELGYFAANWTVRLLQDPMKICTGRWFSRHTIRRALKRLDYVWKRPRYMLLPDPEREKKKANSPSNSAVAASQCRSGRGRDRLASVSSFASELGPTRRTNPRLYLRPERSSCRLWGDESSNWKAVVSCS